MAIATKTLLKVTDLYAHFSLFGGSRVVKAIDGINFTLEQGETMGLVGESGCGKTTTCHAIFRLLPPAGKIASGSIEFDGQDLMELSEGEMRQIRGRDMGMILQDPMASLDPLFTIMDQVAEPAHHHRGMRGGNLREKVVDLLRSVRIPSPEVRMREFPHQMSGGMRQRIVGAISLSGGPKLIVADEPTTNLDVTIQLQYLNLLRDLQQEMGVSLIFVTHNLGIVAKMCDKVAVMYAGKIVEQGNVRDIYNNPRHPYTKALIESIPKLGNKDPLYVIPGQPPNLADLPTGCAFHPRCPVATDKCINEEPPYVSFTNGQESKCWLSLEDAKNG